MKYAFYATILVLSCFICYDHGRRVGEDASKTLINALGQQIEADFASSPCEPIHAALWPILSVSWAFAWPPVKVAATIDRYRDSDKSKVLARVKEVGPVTGLTWIEERGKRERVVKIIWNPSVE